MAIFKEILRNDGSGITRFYRIDNGSITTLDYDALMNKPKINGKELIGDILIDISDFDLSNYYTKKETNTTIQTQLANYYTKKETDNQITKRITEISTPEVDLTDYYTKAETEALVEEKIEEAKGQDIDLTNYYTKTETDVLIEEKIGEIVTPEVDLTDYYTKTETDDKIEGALESIEMPEVKIDPNIWVVDGYNVVEEDPTSSAPVHYTVEPFGSGYGFEFREDGAYHALNVGVDNSYAMCKIVFKNIGGPTGHFILNFTQKSDYENDYGIISNTDEELIDNLESEEYAQMVLNQAGQIQHPEMMLASYADTTHSIVVKYKKNGEGSYDGEEFSFKVGENGMAVPHILKNKKLVDEDKLNINYYNKEETEAKIDEKLQEFEVPGADLSNYYNKTQTEAKIDEKIADIPVNDILHFKGHVDTINDLPKSGQVSGEVIEPKTTLNDTMYQGFTQPSDTIRTNIQNQRNDGYEYYVGSNWGVINTNHPETIEGVMLFNQSGNTSYINIAVRVNASSTKPCKWTSVYDRNRSDIMKHIYYDDGTIPETGYTNRSLDIFQPAWIILMANSMSSLSILSNITVPFKFKYWDKEQVTFVTNSSGSPGTLSHLNNQSIVAGGFVYNPGYKLFGFDESENPYWITTTESDIIENHVYTVGENKDLYRANEADQNGKKSVVLTLIQKKKLTI